MWCVPEINQELVVQMEDVVRLHVRAHRASEPVVYLDERPVQLFDPFASHGPRQPPNFHPKRRFPARPLPRSFHSLWNRHSNGREKRDRLRVSKQDPSARMRT